MVKKLKWNLILMSLLYVGLGIFLVMKPGTALNIVCYALGGVVLACAAVQLIRYFVVERGVFQSQLTLISGLVCLALGVFLLLRSDIVVSILPIVFGLFVVFDAIGRVQNALDLRRCGYDSWKGFLLLPVLSVVLGVILIANPFGAMETLVMAIGVILIVEGAINLLSALYTILAVRRFAKLHPETQSVLEAIAGEDLNGDGVVAPDVTRTDAEATAVELDHVAESAAVEEPAEAPEAEEAPAALEQGALKVAGTTAEDAAPQEKKAIDLYETAGTEAQDGGSAEPAAGQAAEEEAPAMAVYSGSPFPCATVTLPPEGLQLDLLAGRTPDRESEGQAEFDLTAQEYDTLLAQLDESGLDYTAQETADGNSGLVLVIVKAAN